MSIPKVVSDRVGVFPIAEPTQNVEPSFALRERLLAFADLLGSARQFRDACWRMELPAAKRRRRWKEGEVFSFDPQVQAEWAAARAPESSFIEKHGPRVAARIPEAASAWDKLDSSAFAFIESLTSNPEARRIARALQGLREEVETLAGDHLALRELADLLRVQDDAVFLVLHPASGSGWRVQGSGLENVFQLQILLADLLSKDLFIEALDPRVLSAYRGTDVAPEGLFASAVFGMYAGGALRADGGLPEGMSGSDHWLWGASSVASVPYFEGERVILLSPPPFRMTWEVERRFPRLRSQLQLTEPLPTATVQEWLMRLRSER